MSSKKNHNKLKVEDKVEVTEKKTKKPKKSKFFENAAKVASILGIPCFAVLLYVTYTQQQHLNNNIVDSKDSQIELLTSIRDITIESKDATIESQNKQLELLKALQSDIQTKRLLDAKTYYEKDLKKLLFEIDILVKKLDSLGVKVNRVGLAKKEYDSIRQKLYRVEKLLSELRDNSGKQYEKIYWPNFENYYNRDFNPLAPGFDGILSISNDLGIKHTALGTEYKGIISLPNNIGLSYNPFSLRNLKVSSLFDNLNSQLKKINTSYEVDYNNLDIDKYAGIKLTNLSADYKFPDSLISHFANQRLFLTSFLTEEKQEVSYVYIPIKVKTDTIF